MSMRPSPSYLPGHGRRSGQPLGDAEIARIAGRYHAWRGDDGMYEDVPGFCKRATIEEIRDHGHVLTPGRYVGVAPVAEDGEPFGERMARLTARLEGQFAESAKLEVAMRTKLAALGFGLDGSMDR